MYIGLSILVLGWAAQVYAHTFDATHRYIYPSVLFYTVGLAIFFSMAPALGGSIENAPLPKTSDRLARSFLPFLLFYYPLFSIGLLFFDPALVLGGNVAIMGAYGGVLDRATVALDYPVCFGVIYIHYVMLFLIFLLTRFQVLVQNYRNRTPSKL